MVRYGFPRWLTKRRCMAWTWLATFVVALLLISAAAPYRMVAQGQWSTPENLSLSGTPSYYPDITVDSAGHVYVVWGEYVSEDATPRWPDVLMLRVWDGQAWLPSNDIAITGHLPQIAVDGQGRLHLLRLMAGLRYSRAWAQGDPTNARSWTGNADLGLNSPYWPDMVVDSQNRVHVVFSEPGGPAEERIVDEDGLCVSGCGGIFYTRSTDGGESWSSPVQLDLPAVDAETPRLAVDRLDNIYVVWADLSDAGEQDPPGIGVSFARSTDGGESWSAPYQIVAGEEEYEWPEMVVDSTGIIHVVWRYRNLAVGTIGYTQSSDGGQSWSNVENTFFGSSGAYSVGFAVDSADHLHLVMPLVTGERAGVAHLVRPPGGNWSTPTWVSSDPCNAGSADAELVVSHGNQLHAVWYDRRECELGFIAPSGRGEVFYSTLTTDAPALPLAALPPMPTSPAAPTPTPLPLSSPTLSPAALTWQPAVDQEQQAVPALPPLAVGIGLAVALIVVVVAGWSLRYHR